MSINKAILIGFVGKDPEIRSMQDGREVVSFSLATSESWKDKGGERKEKTEWHKIVIFNPNLVNLIRNYVRKGSKIYIEGSIQTRKWVDKAGKDNYTTEIVLQNFNGNVQLLDDKGTKAIDSHSAAKGDGFAPEPKFDLNDEIPF